MSLTSEHNRHCPLVYQGQLILLCGSFEPPSFYEDCEHLIQTADFRPGDSLQQLFFSLWVCNTTQSNLAPCPQVKVIGGKKQPPQMKEEECWSLENVWGWTASLLLQLAGCEEWLTDAPLVTAVVVTRSLHRAQVLGNQQEWMKIGQQTTPWRRTWWLWAFLLSHWLALRCETFHEPPKLVEPLP